MNILGIGTEIVECPRIGKMVEHHGELFLRRVFTDREIRFCQSRKHAIEHFSGLWAAKEAIFKALGGGWSRGTSWTDLEIRQSGGSAPAVHIGGLARERAIRRGVGDVLVSISHCRTYATAYAMALGVEPPKAPDKPSSV